MEDKIISTIEHEDKYKEKVAQLSKRLDTHKQDFFDIINQLIFDSSDFEKIPEIQVRMLSQRHRILDYMTNDLNKALIASRTLYEKGLKNSLNQIKTNFSIKLTSDREKSIVNDADTRVFKEMIELIESQIYFAKETIKLLDNLGYSIKNRIEINKFQKGE